MKILLITQEPPLQNAQIVSGNAVRTRQLHAALEAASHSVLQTWLSADRSRPKGAFRNRDELHSLLIEHSPDAIIVSYWELLGLLPGTMDFIVILDYVAPRSLEEMFESPSTVRDSMRRLRVNLERCDAIMVGNEQQGHLLINTLIEAGFDLRDANPILTVPLGAESAGPPSTSPENPPCVLVAGGVNWPWRVAGSYSEELEKLACEMHPAIKIEHFGGLYRWHAQDSVAMEAKPAMVDTAKVDTAIVYRELEP